MSNEILFRIAPYVAAALFLIVAAVRLRTRDRRGERLRHHWLQSRGFFWHPWLWKTGLMLTVLLYALMLCLPGQLLVLRKSAPWGLALEWLTLMSGLMLAAGWCQVLWVGRNRFTLSEAAFMGVLGVSIGGGLLTSFLYPWHATWALVTMVPYLRSLLALDPASYLVAELPYAARLQVFSAIAALALFPFTRPAAALLLPLHRIKRGLLGGLEWLGEGLAAGSQRTAARLWKWMEEEYE